MTQNPEPIEELDDEKAEPKPASKPRLFLWLFVLGLGMLFIPLLLFSGALKDENDSLGTQVDSLMQTLTSTARPEPKFLALKGSLVEAQKQLVVLQSIEPTLSTKHIDWPAIMAEISKFDTNRIILTGVTQADTRAVLNGMADSENGIMNYAEILRESGQFKFVTVQNITLKPMPTLPKGMPTLTPAPGSKDDKPNIFTISVEFKVD